MAQDRLPFDDVPEMPIVPAEQRAIGWVVTRIRTREDAEEALRIARDCVVAAGIGPGSSARDARLRTGLAGVAAAVETWDTPEPADAERLQVWDMVEAELMRRATDLRRPDRQSCASFGRLYFAALKQAYAIQKAGNQAATMLGRPRRRLARADGGEPSGE